jgi:hypothetical protein
MILSRGRSRSEYHVFVLDFAPQSFARGLRRSVRVLPFRIYSPFATPNTERTFLVAFAQLVRPQTKGLLPLSDQGNNLADAALSTLCTTGDPGFVEPHFDHRVAPGPFQRPCQAGHLRQ